MAKFQTFGALTSEESSREREHKALARRAAAEGIVLLKNDGALPLQPCKIALYGPGSRMTVKGGSGSGDVRERHSVTIEEGLLNAGFSFPTTLWMDRFEGKYAADIAAWRADVERKIKGYGPIRTMKMFDIIHTNPMPYPACTPILPDELTGETDTAIYVLSRQAGEGSDRRAEKGDYLFSDMESESIKTLSSHYKKLILILNCGSATVAIIGMGNAAIDVARTALRNGSRHVTLYARSKKVTASSSEVAYAELDGAEFVFGMQIQKINPEGPLFSKAIFDENDQIIGYEEKPVQVYADSTVISISQTPRGKLVRTTDGLTADEHGTLIVDDDFMTTRPGVFAAGDVVTGAKTVVHAVDGAKKAAAAMIRYMEEQPQSYRDEKNGG